jgi:hypothetical protein
MANNNLDPKLENEVVYNTLKTTNSNTEERR